MGALVTGGVTIAPLIPSISLLDGDESNLGVNVLTVCLPSKLVSNAI